MDGILDQHWMIRCDTPVSTLAPNAPKRSYNSGHIDEDTIMHKMAAAQFKAQCLTVIDQVSRSGRAVVITKHGKPMVKLVPAHEEEDEIFGALADIARIRGDLETTVPASDWGAE
jgi:prevent-host-death family protein